jgi:hypothetical protein
VEQAWNKLSSLQLFVSPRLVFLGSSPSRLNKSSRRHMYLWRMISSMLLYSIWCTRCANIFENSPYTSVVLL